MTNKGKSAELVDMMNSLGVVEAGDMMKLVVLEAVDLEAADVEDLQNLGNLLHKPRAKRYFKFVGLAT